MKTCKNNHLWFAISIVALIVVFALPVIAEQQQIDSNAQQLQAQMKNVEKKQEIVIESMERSYTNGFWFLGAIAGIITLLSALRYVQDQRSMKLMEEQLSDAKELGKSYKGNIDTTNALMTSVKSALDYYKEAQESLKKVAELAEENEKEAKRWEKQMMELNGLAMELTPRCKRNAHNDPIIQSLVRDFHDEHQILMRSFATKEALNANGHFILGFHYRVENKYDEALHEFETAISLATSDREKPEQGAYRSLPTGISLKSWLTKLQNICLYHSAIIYNNRGEYDKAKQNFEEALKYDPIDYQSLAYIPEVMFLGGLASFSRIEAEFKNVISKVETLTQEQEGSFTLSKANLLSLLHLKLGNCYMTESSVADYISHRDLTHAEKEIRSALEYNKDSLFAKLSLAQILFQTNRDSAQQCDLFTSVFITAKGVISNITEAKILIMYYYIMMICCKFGKITNEISGVYAMRIYELVPKLPQPERLRIFSPATKADLTVQEFISEVQNFERGTISPKSSTVTTLESKRLKSQSFSRVGRSFLEP